MRYSTAVIPFSVHFRPGLSLFEQTVYAAKKAMISGQLLPGDTFPSVRALSRELKINPNTAHKIVAQLVTDGLLETRPGIGNVVATLPDSTRKERTQLLGNQVEQLVVESRRLGITLEDLLHSLTQHWNNLNPHENQEARKTQETQKAQTPEPPPNGDRREP
jgi:GntR family transcriptional regulator